MHDSTQHVHDMPGEQSTMLTQMQQKHRIAFCHFFGERMRVKGEADMREELCSCMCDY